MTRLAPHARPTARRRALAAGVGAATCAGALLATGAPSGATTPQPAQGAAVRVHIRRDSFLALTRPTSLGVNTAAWDGNLLGAAVPPLLRRAHLGLVRYPGGSTADVYNWQTNTVNGAPQSVDFSQFMSVLDAAHAKAVVTVNYGTGTPAEAAAWVRYSVAHHDNVRYWEIGNEEYGSWEADNHPAPHTPASYAHFARGFIDAMRKADPGAQIGVSYAFPPSVSGAGVADYQQWNTTVLRADGSVVDFLDAHWYPFYTTTGDSASQVLASVRTIPGLMRQMRGYLARYDRRAYVMVTESNLASAYSARFDTSPVAALFSATAALSWLSVGAKTYDWWDLHNYGSPSGDYGMLSSGTNGEPPLDTPFPSYYGMRMASMVTAPLARLVRSTSSSSNVMAFASTRGPVTRLMLVNENLTSPTEVRVSGLPLGPHRNVVEDVYSAAHPTIARSSAGIASNGRTVLPAESITVFTSRPSAR